MVIFELVELVMCEMLVCLIGWNCSIDLLIDDICVELYDWFYEFVLVVGGWYYCIWVCFVDVICSVMGVE